MTDEEVLRWYTCERKIRYESWDEARRVGLTWNHQTMLHHANPPSPYPCDHCGGYHLGQLGKHPHRGVLVSNARAKYDQWVKKGKI